MGDQWETNARLPFTVNHWPRKSIRSKLFQRNSLLIPFVSGFLFRVYRTSCTRAFTRKSLLVDFQHVVSTRNFLKHSSRMILRIRTCWKRTGLVDALLLLRISTQTNEDKQPSVLWSQNKNIAIFLSGLNWLDQRSAFSGNEFYWQLFGQQSRPTVQANSLRRKRGKWKRQNSLNIFIIQVHFSFKEKRSSQRHP